MTKKKAKAANKNEQAAQEQTDAVEPELMPGTDPETDNESTAEAGDPANELESLRAEAADNLDKFMRAKAETENIRRRAETDVANARKFAIEKFATEVLAIRESLEMARSLDLKEDNQDALDKMHEGLDLILKQFDSTFEKFKMEMVSPEGEKFNPDLHQAISMIESPEVAANHIVSVVQKGCTISDRLLRPALVIVSNGQKQEKSSKNNENGEESAENEANST
jgi:molecular chaperone GrpE